MHVLYAQTKKVFFQLRPASLKRVKWCCSPLWELQKPKARKKTQGIIAASESPANKSDQTRAGILHTICKAFICLRLSRQRQASGTFSENRYRRTNRPPQEGRRASKTPLPQKEKLSLRCRPSGVPSLYNYYQTDQLKSDQALRKCLRLLAL